MLASPYLPTNIFIHGVKICIKNKTLKRRTTIVKHSRFLRNLEAVPVFPAPVIIEAIDPNGEGLAEEGEEEDI